MRRGLADRGLRLARGLRDRAVAEFDVVQSSRHVLQERRTLRRCERGREFAQRDPRRWLGKQEAVRQPACPGERRLTIFSGT